MLSIYLFSTMILFYASPRHFFHISPSLLCLELCKKGKWVWQHCICAGDLVCPRQQPCYPYGHNESKHSTFRHCWINFHMCRVFFKHCKCICYRTAELEFNKLLFQYLRATFQQNAEIFSRRVNRRHVSRHTSGHNMHSYWSKLPANRTPCTKFLTVLVWIVPCSSGLFRVVLECSVLFWIVPSSSGSFRVLLDCSVLFWIVPCSSG